MNSRDNSSFRSIVDSRAFVSVNKSRTGMSESKSATLDSIVEHEVLQKVESEGAGSNLVRIENPSRRLSVDSNIALRRMPTFVRTYREVEWKRVSKSFKSRRASEGCFASNLSDKFETLDRDYSQDAEIHQFVNGKHIIRKRVPIFLSTERPGTSQRYASDDLVPVTSPAWNARGKCLIIKNLSSKKSAANLLVPTVDNYAEESSGQDDDDEDGDDDDDSEESTDYTSHLSQASYSLSSKSPSPVGLSLPRHINIRSPNLRRNVLEDALHKNAPLADSLNGIFNNEISEFQVKPEENTVYTKNADIPRDGTQQLHIAVDNNMNTIDKRDAPLVILPKDMGASVHLRIPTPYSVRTINVPTKLGKDFMCLKANYHLGSDEIAVARWPVASPSADCLLLCSTLIPKSGVKDSSTKLTPDANFIKKCPESVTSRISPRHDTVITQPGNKVNVNVSETVTMYSQYHMSALPKSDYDKVCTQKNPHQSVSLSHSREPPQPRIESPSEKLLSLAGKSAIWKLLLESLVTLSVASDKPLASPLTTDKPSGGSTVAIDNKIEQAMDLVKRHLMYAVREEVEILKQQIGEMMERIGQLEYENTVLKAEAKPETLNKLLQPRAPTATPLTAPVSVMSTQSQQQTNTMQSAAPQSQTQVQIQTPASAPSVVAQQQSAQQAQLPQSQASQPSLQAPHPPT